MGAAPVCKNARFDMTSVGCRWGIQQAMQSPNKDAQITGALSLIYTPENPGEVLFQRPMIFDTRGTVLIESPVGSGRLVPVAGVNITPPQNAHMMGAEVYNRAVLAFSDLKKPLGPMGIYSLSSGTFFPYGQKPLGFSWAKNLGCVVGEYCTPSAAAGNGHLYRCIQAGATGAVEPVFPLTTGGTVGDGGVIWQESTPVVTAVAGGNVDLNPAGTTRYIAISFANETDNFSGITQGAILSIQIPTANNQIQISNLPIGPTNVMARVIGPSIANGTSAGPFFYIQDAAVSAGVAMSSTVVPDNVTTTVTINFTDQYLLANTSTTLTDRFRVIAVPPAVDAYYSPTYDRVILTGVDGLGSAHLISLAADSESFYGDTGALQVGNGDGQRTICAREFQGTLYSLKERGGYVITPLATDPSSWAVQNRWMGSGPCGPRAVDVCTEFLFYVHRTGIYVLDAAGIPHRVTDELPVYWSQVNWDAQQTVWVCIDEDQKEVRIGLPVGLATVPNQVLTMNYREGTASPIKFTAYEGTETAPAPARKWSIDDLAANLAIRCERQLLPNASPFGAFRQSQILLASSSPDGTVQAITPGVYNDNGGGIDFQYETSCPGQLMPVQMLGGVEINAIGEGLLDVSVMVMRTLKTSAGQGMEGPEQQTNEIKLPPFRVTPEAFEAYSAGARGQNERFRLRFTNGKRPDHWASVKSAAIYTRQLFSARTGS
jgi:hypothetical protein